MRILLDEIKFNEKGFRRFRNTKFSLSKNITVITGKNGLGKSTLLGLLSVGSQYKAPITARKLENGLLHFKIELDNFFNITLEDYIYSKKDSLHQYELIYKITNSDQKIHSENNKNLLISKKIKMRIDKTPLSELCNLSDKKAITKIKQTKTLFPKEYLKPKDLEKKSKNDIFFVDRIRTRIQKDSSNLIANNDSSFKLDNPNINSHLQKHLLGSEKRIELPTIFLTYSRIYPWGETTAKTQTNNKIPEDSEDINFLYSLYARFFEDIMVYNSDLKNSKLTSYKDTSINKNTLMPDINYDVRSISSGQDTIQSIISTLANFNRLKRVLQEEYPGGLLIIDEIEAGLHEDWQEKICEVLFEYSQKLNLQVVFSTHSTTIINMLANREKTEKFSNKRNKLEIKMINLQTGPEKTTQCAEFNSLQESALNAKRILTNKLIPQENIYLVFEDTVALSLYKSILKNFDLKSTNSKLKNIIESKKINYIPIKLGHTNIKKISSPEGITSAKNPFIKNILYIFDADVTETNYKNNEISMPGNVYTEDNVFSNLFPEKLAYVYLREKYKQLTNNNDRAWLDQFQLKTGISFDLFPTILDISKCLENINYKNNETQKIAEHFFASPPKGAKEDENKLWGLKDDFLKILNVDNQSKIVYINTNFKNKLNLAINNDHKSLKSGIYKKWISNLSEFDERITTNNILYFWTKEKTNIKDFISFFNKIQDAIV